MRAVMDSTYATMNAGGNDSTYATMNAGGNDSTYATMNAGGNDSTYATMNAGGNDSTYATMNAGESPYEAAVRQEGTYQTLPAEGHYESLGVKDSATKYENFNARFCHHANHQHQIAKPFSQLVHFA